MDTDGTSAPRPPVEFRATRTKRIVLSLGLLPWLAGVLVAMAYASGPAWWGQLALAVILPGTVWMMYHQVRWIRRAPAAGTVVVTVEDEGLRGPSGTLIPWAQIVDVRAPFDDTTTTEETYVVFNTERTADRFRGDHQLAPWVGRGAPKGRAYGIGPIGRRGRIEAHREILRRRGAAAAPATERS